MTDDQLLALIREAQPLAIARAITRVERGGPPAREVIRALFPYTGRAHLVGLTGAPGTGKSTLVNILAQQFRAAGRRVAVLAVDPSSPFSGGAILGDRLRMQDLFGTGVFIRSMASRGQLGGLAAAVSDAVTVLDAGGFDPVLIETVGAGQGEVEIARHAHTTVVLEAPGLGDDIQAIKAGILEIADILVVNKADRDGVNATVAALEMNLNLNSEPRGWRPPVLKTIALSGQGVDEVMHAIERHRAYLDANNLRTARDAQRFGDELTQLLERELVAQLVAGLPAGEWDGLLSDITARRRDIYAVAEELLAAHA